MKRMICLLTFAVLFAAASACLAADDANLGTWKLNEAKSKYSPGAPKNTSVVYEAAGDSIKVTVDGVAPMANRRTMNGPANSTAKTTPNRRSDCRRPLLQENWCSHPRTDEQNGRQGSRQRKDHYFGRRQVPHRLHQRHRRQWEKITSTAVYDKQ